MNTLDLSKLPSTFYRVTTRALVFDAHDRLLVVRNGHGGYEIPGGGWEYGESYEACLRRELQEELSAGVLTIDKQHSMWTGVHHSSGYKMLRIGSRVTLASDNFVPSDGMTAVEWVDQATFLKIDWKYEGDAAEMNRAIWHERVRGKSGK